MTLATNFSRVGKTYFSECKFTLQAQASLAPSAATKEQKFSVLLFIASLSLLFLEDEKKRETLLDDAERYLAEQTYSQLYYMT